MGTQARTTSRRVREARAQAQKRTQTRHRYAAIGGGAIIVVLLAAIAFVLVDAARGEQSAAPAPSSTAVPAGTTAGGAIVVGSGPVTVTVYLDYLCPFCGRFERANSAELERLVADGTVRLELHPLAFLDDKSRGTRYSTRTANAVATVADQAPRVVLTFSDALFAQQPGEGGPGLTDEQIASIAAGAGVPTDVAATFTARRFEHWVASSTDAAFQRDGVTGTPTVKVNGKLFDGDLYTAGPLTAAITAAKGSA
ncbi:DsbA family protein [Dactylosporangium sp. NBC_01737]|uniref:DsbA family protein n=1 Tax=Dactylosporangium sp. NBC_01737 TaxID=2975959 RepID=UPI002E1334CF|nr:DsbA family protein [Dactylosporangium sp. NBC_01737]